MPELGRRTPQLGEKGPRKEGCASSEAGESVLRVYPRTIHGNGMRVLNVVFFNRNRFDLKIQRSNIRSSLLIDWSLLILKIRVPFSP